MAVPSSLELHAYNAYIETIREKEYPMLEDALYLDHAGTTLYSKTLMDCFHAEMMASLYGNPHSGSPSSQRSTIEIERIRLDALKFFGADPEVFDLVFTSNTTAAIKLVMEALRGQEGGFWYGYHVDSHTSLVGVRESANGHHCFESDAEVEEWIAQGPKATGAATQLFAYPAQSNMTGHRLPLNWPQKLSSRPSTSKVYTLLDAAAYAATSPLQLDRLESPPDFVVLSFSKIFGFPDLGALIVKKDTSRLFEYRRYFGGGTVDMVVCLKEQWHANKTASLHERLEDGTLPVHSVIALGSAIETHRDLFGSLEQIANHTSALAKQLHEGLDELRHANGRRVCHVYTESSTAYDDPLTQGPTIAFNMRDSQDHWISSVEVEKLASIKSIHIRTGGLCNPGGVAKFLDLSPWEMRDNFSAGFRCGAENDIMNGKPTGVIRVSLGAMSTKSDVERFLNFVNDFFMDKSAVDSGLPSPVVVEDASMSRLFVESLTVYPIKSCGGWQVPYGTSWDVRDEGLAWDREWCIVSQGTGTALSQKRYPKMALLRPRLDFKCGVLDVGMTGSTEQISVPLSQDPSYLESSNIKDRNTTICGDTIKARLYTSERIAAFFTTALGVACTLARYPAASASSRHSKSHLRHPHQNAPSPLLLSNESPILTITRSSLNRLNETIKLKSGKAAHPSVFRANIILAEDSPGQEQPWAEDAWSGMEIGQARFDFLGGCRRCHMVCVDQESGEKNQEPFVTLAKIRRFERGVMFGVHTGLVEGGSGRIEVGMEVRTWK